MKLPDSSCIICVFNEIYKPFILTNWIKHGYEIVITYQVYRELQENEVTANKIKYEIKKGNIKIINLIKEEDFQKFRNRYPILGDGEISVILTGIELNKQEKKYYAILDDKKARKVAISNKVKLTGTYGLLKALVSKGFIKTKQFYECKELMKKSKFRINFDKIK